MINSSLQTTPDQASIQSPYQTINPASYNMSRFGIDLFARENPPPQTGYHTNAENYHIHGIGPQLENLTVSALHPMFVCI
jgi:hypothetical protein